MARSGVWFDPKLVEVVEQLVENPRFIRTERHRYQSAGNEFTSCSGPFTFGCCLLGMHSDGFGKIVDAKARITLVIASVLLCIPI